MNILLSVDIFLTGVLVGVLLMRWRMLDEFNTLRMQAEKLLAVRDKILKKTTNKKAVKKHEPAKRKK